MLNLIFGFLIADFLYSLILFFRKDLILSLPKNINLFIIIFDVILLIVIIFIKFFKNVSRKKEIRLS